MRRNAGAEVERPKAERARRFKKKVATKKRVGVRGRQQDAAEGSDGVVLAVARESTR